MPLKMNQSLDVLSRNIPKITDFDDNDDNVRMQLMEERFFFHYK